MSEEWCLYYWAGFPGRGEFLRLIFEEAGVKYTEVNDGTRLVSEIIQGQSDFFPHFAPPVIKKGNFTLSQAHVASRYLAEKFDMLPGNEVDNAHAEQINLDCHDYIAEGRLAFHGIHNVGPYKSQKEETQPYIDRFIESRFPRWLKYFERALVANGGGKGFIIGSKCCYADLTLFHCLRATESQFPEAWAKADYIPALKAYKERIASRPNIAAFLKSGRSLPFAGDSMM
ncbi:glutathione S-transferase-like [Mercenaria mercenaria]|uniref:glutathione S-transferase-like n=1 Tax=Mercenaria mercenaria TaxID=6596 RepID=UPI00234E40C1|nr:glutathione S-transferase-like [Mercenaria mercenaria]